MVEAFLFIQLIFNKTLQKINKCSEEMKIDASTGEQF